MQQYENNRFNYEFVMFIFAVLIKNEVFQRQGYYKVQNGNKTIR